MYDDLPKRKYVSMFQVGPYKVGIRKERESRRGVDDFDTTYWCSDELNKRTGEIGFTLLGDVDSMSLDEAKAKAKKAVNFGINVQRGRAEAAKIVEDVMERNNR